MDNGFARDAEEDTAVSESGDSAQEGTGTETVTSTGLQPHHIMGILVILAAIAYVVATVLFAEDKKEK